MTPPTGGQFHRNDGSNAMKLCEIDKAVLAAHEAGREWKTVRGIRSARRFGRVLARAKRRKATQR
jgi:hypothetical protein